MTEASKRLADFKKEIEEMRYRDRILEALLVSSITEDNSRLPTIQEYILSEVVNGTIDYAGGNAGKINYQKFRHDRNKYENELIKYFKEEMSETKGEMSPKIRESIQKMTDCHWVYVPEPGDNYPTCELYGCFRGFGGICPVTFHSSFSLPLELVVRVQKEVLPSLSKDERRDVKGIGKAMRKYINDDLEYIREHYHW